jgi:signal transduction histidine kinase
VGEPASVKTKKEREREKSDPGDDPEQAYSAYAALEKLNLASNQRAERRRQTIQVEKRSELPPAPSAPRIESAGAPLEDEGFSPESGGELTAVPVHTADDEVARDADRLAQGARPVPRKDERPAPGDADRAEADLAPPRTAAARMALGDSGRARLPEAASVEARRAPFADAVLEGQVEDDSVRIAIDPMTGVALLTPEPMLALYRSVIVGAQGYRQGLIIDLDALGAMLEADVVRAGGLEDIARASFAVTAAPMPPAAGPGYSFVHRFAEPFDALSVRLDLQPLGGDADERQTLLALAGLVMVLTFGGLFAVDRMTAVVIDFAERRGNFVAAVSHELKTPLTSIRMYAEMLRDGLVGSEAKRVEYLATIGDESERLSRLIDNVLEFSRLEKGRAELALVAGDVAGPVQEAVQRLGPFADRAGFALRVEVEADLPPVLFERDALMQVVFNLIDNAIKYATSATRRDIIVRVARAGDGVEVTVRDFGPGVARAALRRVFEPFHRGESELTRAAKGTGIGLALVAELSAAMKARVVGESPEDGGFLVRVTFAHR